MPKKQETEAPKADWHHQRDVECINNAKHFLADAVNHIDGAKTQIEIAFLGHDDWNDMIQDSIKDALAILAPVQAALETWWDPVPENQNHKDGEL